MRSKIRFLIITILLLICGLMSITGIAFAEDKYTFIAITHGPVTEPFHIKMQKGFETACALFPEEVKGIWMGPEKYSVENYVEMINSAVEMNPDAIFCTMAGLEAIDKTLREVINKGIPVIAFNTADFRPKEERIPYLSYVGANSYQEGVMIASEALKRAKFEITGAYALNSNPGHPGQDQRIKGFVEVVKDAGIPIHVVLGGKVDAAEFSELCFAYVQGHPETNLTFTTFAYECELNITKFEREGYKPGIDGNILNVSVGSTATLFDYLKEGKIPFLLDQQGYFQGYYPVIFAYNYLKYGLVPPPTFDTGPNILDMSAYEIYMKWAPKMIR